MPIARDLGARKAREIRHHPAVDRSYLEPQPADVESRPATPGVNRRTTGHASGRLRFLRACAGLAELGEARVTVTHLVRPPPTAPNWATLLCLRTNPVTGSSAAPFAASNSKTTPATTLNLSSAAAQSRTLDAWAPGLKGMRPTVSGTVSFPGSVSLPPSNIFLRPRQPLTPNPNSPLETPVPPSSQVQDLLSKRRRTANRLAARFQSPHPLTRCKRPIDGPLS